MSYRGLAILGSTGSIGLNALDVVRRLRRQKTVKVLAARQNADLLLKQILEFHPSFAVLDEAPTLAQGERRVRR